MQLEFTAEAEDDLEAMRSFCLERSPGWAEKVEARIFERVWKLALTPRIGCPTRLSPVRQLSITDIQYVIDYEPAEGGVRILRVQHTREIR